MNSYQALPLTLLLVLLGGCYATFVDLGVGYTRFETEAIRSTVQINSQPVQTKLHHVDGFLTRTRAGGTFLEALPQLRAGVELRGGVGGAQDEKNVDRQTAYSQIVMLLFGGGPFLSWKQPIGDVFYLEGGSFLTGYTVGVHEKGRRRYGFYFDEKQTGATGWSGGFFGKLGIVDNSQAPVSFALETSYELGKWHFGGDIGEVFVQNVSVMVTAELDF